MRITLLNPPHTAIGSRIPREHLPPLGLLAIGGPLIDAGHNVCLVNADRHPLSLRQCVDAVLENLPEAVLVGHSGSSSAHPTVAELCRLIRARDPNILIIYGGVHPTYHWREVLDTCPEIDVIVRGEGEATVTKLIGALETRQDLGSIPGLAFRRDGTAQSSGPAAMVGKLDDYRIGWELIDFADYSYWGGKRAVVVQFSRGCPHLCTYCGQRGFWTRWRHRDPQKLADEIAWLHKEQGVELINLADENPTSSRRVWLELLHAIIAHDMPDLIIIGSTRADDIVRDADILHLYKKAGVLRFLMGMENTDADTLKTIRKGGSTSKDRQAISLLRQHNIISLCTWASGFEEETDRDHLSALRQLIAYDPDQVMSIHATPHRWTPFYQASKHRKVIEPDQRKWDYKHQVLETRNIPPWRVFLWVKLTEFCLQARPKALLRVLAHPDRNVRHGMRWYTRMGRRVWLSEVIDFIAGKRLKNGPLLEDWAKGEGGFPEEAMARPVAQSRRPAEEIEA